MTNWGRWGRDDERGALNLLGATTVRRGIRSVRSGRTISLGLPLRSGKGPAAAIRPPMQHFMTRDGGDYAAGLPERSGYGFADDTIVVPCHGTTHIDALAHVWQEGMMWNGFPATEVTSRGARRCGVDKIGPIVTRALFLDFAPEAGDSGPLPAATISADDLDKAVARAGLTPQPGDALIVRTGWLAAWRDGRAGVDTWPGLGSDCAEWVADRGIALVGADNIAVEVGPSSDPGCAMPLHVALLRDCGVFFVELLDLETLATAAVTEFLLVLAPLNIEGAVGSPVAPVAIC